MPKNKIKFFLNEYISEYSSITVALYFYSSKRYENKLGSKYLTGYYLIATLIYTQTHTNTQWPKCAIVPKCHKKKKKKKIEYGKSLYHFIFGKPAKYTFISN